MKNFPNGQKSTNRFNGLKAALVSIAALPGLALAQSSTPGAIMAGELSGGKADVGLVIAATAVILGFILVWKLVRRA